MNDDDSHSREFGFSMYEGKTVRAFYIPTPGYGDCESEEKPMG